MFLQLKDGDVIVTPEGMTLPEVKTLIKSTSKKYYQQALTFLYYMYDKEHSPYRNLLPDRRAARICQSHLGVDDPEHFYNNKYVHELSIIYIETQYTELEQLYEGTKKKYR